jgi:virulence factor Mce-like protein
LSGLAGLEGGKKASVGLGLAVALALSGVATATTIFSLGSGNNDYQVKVHFSTANGLIDGSDVLIGGVKVGVVDSVVVDNSPPADPGSSSFANPTTSATATISIKRQYAPLHQGATAAVRPKSLLGEKYVALTVGDPGKEALADGTTLPPEATSVNVELDQLVGIFDEPTRKQLQKLIDNLAHGLIDQGRNTNQTFQVGNQDLGNFAQLTDVLQTRDAELKRLIDALNKITQSLSTDQQRANYPDLLAHSDAVLKTLIAEDADVQTGIDRMNSFFGILDAGFAGRQQDFTAVMTQLPRTISDLDALATSLAPQGHVILPITQQASWGVVASDLLFGATPSTKTFTDNIYTRVLPAQGCFNVNTRYDANGVATRYDVNGVQNDASPAIRQPQLPAAAGNPVCSTPIFEPHLAAGLTPGPCSSGIGSTVYAANCAFALSGSLCVGFGFNPQHPQSYVPDPQCDLLTQGVGGPYPVLPPAASTSASAGAAAETQAGDQFLGYLLQ